MHNHIVVMTWMTLTAVTLQSGALGSEASRTLRDDRLNGTWSFLWSRVNGGPKVRGAASDTLTLTFRQGKILVDYGDDGKDTWTFELLRVARLGEAGKMLIHGPREHHQHQLYDFVKGQLILCQTALGDQWPTAIDWGAETRLSINAYESTAHDGTHSRDGKQK